MTGVWYVVGLAFAGVTFVFLTIGLAWLITAALAVSRQRSGKRHAR